MQDKYLDSIYSCTCLFTMNADNTTEWFELIDSQRINKSTKQALKEYVTLMLRSNLPVILNTSHLAKLVGLTEKTLVQIISSSNNFYREFTIPKRHGGTRLISAPYPSLLSVQEWIYEKILLPQYEFDCCVTGFVQGRSILDNASPHCNNKVVLQLDIKDFFPSITLNRVINVFKVLGYYNQMAYNLASLCCQNGVLPQGAPTSPILSNIIAGRMDRRLKGLCTKLGITYTRYADDLSFSGEHIGKSFIKYVNKIIQSEGFIVNQDKTKLLHNNSRKIITGVSISSGKPTIPKSLKRRLRKEAYYINKYGLEDHMAHEQIDDLKYYSRLKGYFAYWNSIEKDNGAEKYKIYLNRNRTKISFKNPFEWFFEKISSFFC